MTTSRRPAGRFRDARLWLWLNADPLNVLLILILTSAVLAGLGAGLVWLLRPSGPPIATEGRVVGLGVVERDRGSVPTASVEVRGQTVRILMNKNHGCQVGDVIQLRRRATRWGHLTGSTMIPRPCSPPPPATSR